MKILIVDDQHERHMGLRQQLFGHETTHAFGYTEAVADLKHNVYDCLYLDHDLANNDVRDGRALTGYDIACWLEEHPGRCPPQVVVHSHNPGGAARILTALQLLDSVVVVRQPFRAL